MVNGLEWEYGASDTRSSPGVSCTLPGGTADHRFRGTADTMDIVSDLLEDCCFKTLDKVCMPFAGAFHAGVEVHGLELSFGETESRGSLRGTAPQPCSSLPRNRVRHRSIRCPIGYR
ncbi:unnamed protein product [Symbiodinium sp. KB8]|nr:unnamed protein product [Symbiodinium sp. KB8]